MDLSVKSFICVSPGICFSLLDKPEHHQTVSPVQGDAAQVEYGRRGQQDVQRGPDQAEGLAVDPVLVDQLDGAEGHDQHRHQQVGERQRHDEVVGLDFPGGGRKKGFFNVNRCD